MSPKIRSSGIHFINPVKPPKASTIFKSNRRSNSSTSTSLFPPKTWDSHTHVCDPVVFPLSKTSSYIPHAAHLSDLNALHTKLQIPSPNIVLVQPSTYGLDNSCLLSALKELTPTRGRGVVTIDPLKTTEKTLHKLHDQGVRGVRVNLKSVDASPTPENFKRILKTHAKAIKPMGSWVLQIYADMATMPIISSVLPDLGVKVCVDHFGSPAPIKYDESAERFNPSSLEGWDAMMEMMRGDNFFVKISAAYRISAEGGWTDIDVLARGLLSERRGEGVVWASDWPHTRFEGVDIRPFVEKCFEWCGRDEDLREKLFRKNAEFLWDVKY